MGNELTVRNDMGLSELGKVLSASGYFADAKDAGQAVVKVIAGQELGFGPIASMTGIYIVKGRVTLSANLIAAAIQRSGRYKYRIAKMTDDECTVLFFEGNEQIGESSFTMADAGKAGLAGGDNWRKYPRNMLFARALSNGAKWFTPDVFGGPIYTPDELGEPVDGETGEIIEGQFTRPDPEPQGNNGNGSEPDPEPQPAGKPQRPYDPATLREGVQAKVAKRDNGKPSTQAQQGLIASKLEECFAGDPDTDNKRHSVMGYLVGKESTKDLTFGEASVLLDWLVNPDTVPNSYDLNEHVAAEAHGVMRLTLAEAGQEELPL